MPDPSLSSHNAADGATPSHITDHAFDPIGAWWSRCGAEVVSDDGTRLCLLGEAAHERTLGTLKRGVEHAKLARRCPTCVELGTKPCPHQLAQIT